jgi:hypothetical protein
MFGMARVVFVNACVIVGRISRCSFGGIGRGRGRVCGFIGRVRCSFGRL